MRNRLAFLFMGGVILFTAIVFSAWAQRTIATVPHCPVLMTYDGVLDDDVWTAQTEANGLAYRMDAIFNEVDPLNYTIHRVNFSGEFPPTSNDDIYAVLRFAWDSVALVIGIEFFDDQHATPYLLEKDSAKYTYRDDSYELWIDPLWTDAENDQSKPYWGENFLVWKADQAFVVTGDNKALPLSETRVVIGKHDGTIYNNNFFNNSFDAYDFSGYIGPYSTNDGLNFQAEAALSWDGMYMRVQGQMLPTIVGREIALNVGINDHDIPVGITEERTHMRWNGHDHTDDPTSWFPGMTCPYNKMILGDPIAGGILPRAAVLGTRQMSKMQGNLYDIHGRVIGARVFTKGNLELRRSGNNGLKTLVLR